ncbi:bifunctional ornithine acetyltransferase/N-acetylglutamate synthase [Sporolactobacillus inulinus]|jgi:glutamate N-acetyltransferase/amino-acid N-acetyltransferase|uniref:Arginine biosynthesis bifunctional protein ArgJ n=2 Tax=Sporolactobacillus inulinus TaxID=2078 RepID=A0A4Y1ZD85_9BACL|nr:bifunctional ornithine acetyltransferase/N-acetylglutamate synthase [Sporolactobacillus inulinus]KLI03148.1 N-acetylglutamate synthase [Sporolactobacillus inulinus CASD]GAY77004.1 glutamate N-acetyltransferase [Sporolactobacillus inulinus]GEB76629.1 arginine biosynthesis bifunctional protein ArgJ [Sporolactobacillus inulinus]
MEKLDQKPTITSIENGSVGSAKGFKTGGMHIGMRTKKPDLGWIYSEVPATAAGVYTTNVFQAAPLQVTQESIAEEKKLQAVLVNTVSANSCTGQQGLENARVTRQWLAQHLGITDHLVGVASTGVIGMQLPMEKIKKGIAAIDLSGSEAPFEEAILTTDTKTKHLAVTFEIDGKPVTIGGACKGSGMIHPNMATMLGFVTTDAAVAPDALKQALKTIVDKTFNRITVDGDTSTNDMVLLLANGQAENQPLSAQHPEWPVFLKGLEAVCQGLAKFIAGDGEGATKLIEVQVTGAKDNQSAEVIAKTIVGSSLVKTAVFGSDANWGRIVCAMGYSGEAFDPNHVTLKLGDLILFENGVPTPFDEQQAKNYLDEDSIVIKASLGEGNGSAVAWGCDLTYDYVKINASYRS